MTKKSAFSEYGLTNTRIAEEGQVSPAKQLAKAEKLHCSIAKMTGSQAAKSKTKKIWG